MLAGRAMGCEVCEEAMRRQPRACTYPVSAGVVVRCSAFSLAAALFPSPKISRQRRLRYSGPPPTLVVLR
jgi:hypothetical protein